MKFEHRAYLPASPDRVWEILADWERQVKWMPDVAWIRLLGPQREMGAHLLVRTKVLGIPLVTDELEVTEWEPPRRLAVRHRGLVWGGGSWLLEPEEEGTRFTWSESFHMKPPVLGDVALWFYSPMQRRALRRSTANLRRMVEAS